ncbi:hypothetical protein EZV62_025612 [Acer yangbiense]|uniref:Phorbol-ester/DAG-type domain-containing protein n=1 Tax=Acer yangbiense TaxID=1000413 RepID=A0A5C7GYZ2_9ROSI|nr:hypothetical protein EZV62_025612 [Acer yangbiense]
MEEIFLPELHPHNLERKFDKRPYVCHCRALGSGLRFRCEQCEFDLHDECEHVKQTTTHDFYKNSIFNFFREPPDHSIFIYCAMCGGLVEGFVYYCEELNKYLHPCCHSLPSKFKFYHLEFTLRDKISSSTCLWCSNGSYFAYKDSTGLSYVSKCKKYNFHVFCAKQMMRQQYKKEVRLGNSLEQSLKGCLEIHLGGISKRQRRRNIVMSFVITNLVLELTSAILDQVSSSVSKTQFALFGMLISLAAMLTCILELIYQVQTEKPIWRRRGTLLFPWFYYPHQGRKPFGTFKDIIGLVCALCQCVLATVSYCYLRQQADNLIRISLFPIIFAFGILISQILKNQGAKNSSCGNETCELIDNNLDQSLQGCLEIHLGGISKRQRRRNIVMSFVITNLVLELSLAILDQVSSSMNKTRFALFGMLISSVAMLTCILELIYEFRTENLIWRWSSNLPFPWYYYRDQGRKPFGNFKDIVGLVCALCQFVLATLSYCYIRKYTNNPIKISICPIIFAFGILFSQILKNQEIEKPSCENETREINR